MTSSCSFRGTCGFWSSLRKAVIRSLPLVSCSEAQLTVSLVELENSLPNGFHDSALTSFEVDYGRRILRARLSLKMGVPDDSRETRNDGRDAIVEITGLIFLVVDPADNPRDFSAGDEVWIADSYETIPFRSSPSI